MTNKSNEVDTDTTYRLMYLNATSAPFAISVPASSCQIMFNMILKFTYSLLKVLLPEALCHFVEMCFFIETYG